VFYRTSKKLEKLEAKVVLPKPKPHTGRQKGRKIMLLSLVTLIFDL